MLTVSLGIALALLVLAMVLNLWRVVRGPDLLDRVVGLDTLYINALAVLIVYGIYLDDARYYETALLIALLGFVSTMALCKFLLRGDIIE
jgi:multicomponent K+:H+ antiporter subunit F